MDSRLASSTQSLQLIGKVLNHRRCESPRQSMRSTPWSAKRRKCWQRQHPNRTPTLIENQANGTLSAQINLPRSGTLRLESQVARSSRYSIVVIRDRRSLTVTIPALKTAWSSTIASLQLVPTVAPGSIHWTWYSSDLHYRVDSVVVIVVVVHVELGGALVRSLGCIPVRSLF